MTSHVEVLSAGWFAEVVAGSFQVVVRGPSAADTYQEALVEAHAAAQEALDLLTMRGVANLVVAGADSGHVLWWTQSGDVILRVVGAADVGMSFSATATVTDKDGNVVTPPAPVLTWHASLRYFRLAQATSDLFDAYRNMYLALEALLSTIVPQRLSAAGRPSEREGDWLLRALAHVDTLLPLGPYTAVSTGNPVDNVFRDLYAGTRTGLFHAKSGRPVLLPHGFQDRPKVVASLERLSRLFLDLFEVHLGFRRPAGLMTYGGFEMMTRGDAEAILTDDVEPESPDAVVINPAGGGVARLQTRRAPELGEPGHTVWLGEGVASDVASTVSVLRKVGLERDGLLSQYDQLDDPVSLDGIDILQIQQGLRLVNRQLPRFRFQT